MPSFRFSMAAMMAIVAVIALGLAGMVSASSFWTASAATVTLALLLAAVLTASLLKGTDRTFWAGFALFGWTYLLLVNWDWVGGQFGHDLTAGLSDVAEAIFPDVSPPRSTLTPQAMVLQQVYPNTGMEPDQRGSVPTPSGASTGLTQFQYLDLVRQRQTKIGNFVQIGRMCLSLLFALGGGFIGHSIADRRESRSRPAGQDSEH